MSPMNEGPVSSVYSEAYGLEMTVDSDWPVDTVILCPPRFVAVMADVTSMGVKTGASYFPGNQDLQKILDEQGTWLLCYPEDPIARATQTSINILLEIDSQKQLKDLLPLLPSDPHRLAIAFVTSGIDKPSKAQSTASNIRSLLDKHNLGETRILASGVFDLNRFRKFIAKPDIDGVFIHNGESAEMISLIAASVGAEFN
jgi:hypothetical protein